MIELACNECGRPMTWRGTSIGWKDDWGFDTFRFECPGDNCETFADVAFRTFTPLPKGQAS